MPKKYKRKKESKIDTARKVDKLTGQSYRDIWGDRRPTYHENKETERKTGNKYNSEGVKIGEVKVPKGGRIEIK